MSLVSRAGKDAMAESGTTPVRRAPAWTPPPRRGLVPLRPIPFGVVLGAPFRLQRRTPRTTLAPALVVSLVATGLATLVQWGVSASQQAALDASYYSDYLVARNVLGVTGSVLGWAPLVLALAANALLAGPVVVAASRALLAERVSFRGVRWRLRGRAGRLVGWSLLVLAAGAGVLAVAALPLLAVAASSPVGGALAFVLGFLEAVGIVLGLGYVCGRLGFTAHAIALEGLPIGAALSRSWRLTRRAGWRLFGSQLLVWCIIGIASAVLQWPVTWALDLLVGFVLPHGGTAEQAALYDAARAVVLLAVAAITGAFGLVVQSVVAALLYLDARMRVEGLDLALARYVDERERGVAVPDPFPPGGSA